MLGGPSRPPIFFGRANPAVLDQDPERRIEVVGAREVTLVRSMTLAASERTALARDDPPQDTARVLLSFAHRTGDRRQRPPDAGKSAVLPDELA